MTSLLVLASLFLLMAAGLGLVAAHRHPEENWEEQVARGLLPPVMALLVFLLWSNLCGIPAIDWNAARVTPSVALLHGINFYGTITHGPYLGWTYGPVMPLLLLPAAMLPGITFKLLGAGLLAQAITLLPLILTQDWSVAATRKISVLGGLLAVFACLCNWPTLELLSLVHVDAFALGLGVGSCLVLTPRNDSPPGQKRLVIAALLAALCVWTKQIDVPVVVAQFLFLGAAWGWRNAWRYAIWFFGLATGLTAVFTGIFGGEEIVFNLFWVSAHQAWTSSLARHIYWQVLMGAPFILLLLVAACRPESGRVILVPGSSNTPLRAQPWLLVALAGLCLIPTSAMAAAKFSGGINSYHSLYFFIAASAMAVGRRAQDAIGKSAERMWRRLLLGSLAIIATIGIFNVVTLHPLRLTPDLRAEQTLALARSQPGTLYLPWYPLAGLLTEKKLYAFDDAVFNLLAAGAAPDAMAIRATVPAHVRLLAYQTDVIASQAMLAYYPELHRTFSRDGWTIYAPGPSEAKTDPTTPNSLPSR